MAHLTGEARVRPSPWWLRFREDRRGQAVVELALIIPIFLLLLVGMFEFSRAWSTYGTLSDAARQGARAASLANAAVGEDSVRAAIGAVLRSASLDPSRATIALSGVTGATGSLATVQLRYPVELGMVHTLSLGRIGKRIDLAASAVMRNE